MMLNIRYVFNMVLQKLPPDFDFEKIEIYKKALSANAALAELNGLVISIPNYELLLQPLTAREAVASSEIEHIYTTTLELLQAELLPQADLSLAQKETLNYKKALLGSFKSIKESGKIDIDTLIELQARIVPEKSGIRKREVYIGSRDGKIIYTPPKANEIQDLLENLESYISDDSGLDELIKMAVIHYQFEAIHPFLDGNGRAGRILMILYLTLKSRLRFPVLFLSGYIVEYKKRYYELFKLVEIDNNWTEWVLFFLNGVEIMAKETTKRVLEIKELEVKYRNIAKVEIPRMDSQDLVNYLLSKAFYNQADMAKNLNLSRQTASKYLELMMTKGYLESRIIDGRKLYFIQEFIEVLS